LNPDVSDSNNVDGEFLDKAFVGTDKTYLVVVKNCLELPSPQECVHDCLQWKHSYSHCWSPKEQAFGE